MSRPNVCFAAWTLPPGGNVTGTPAHIHKLLRAVNANGADAWLLEADLFHAHQPLALAATVRDTWRTLRERRPDVIHAHGHGTAGFFLPFARALRIPLICEVHGVYVTSARGQPGGRYWLSQLAKQLEFPVLRSVDHVIAQALAMRDRLIAGGVDPHRITMLYPGLRTREFSAYTGPAADIPGIEPGDVVALYAGSTHAYQGLDLLAAAQRHLPPQFRIVLALSTDDPSAEDDVFRQFGFDRERTIAIKLAQAGALTGLFKRADVLVHSRPDIPDNVNVQSKLGLYLAAGRPLAVTNIADYQVLLSGSAGCVLADPNAESIARAIVDAATRPEVAAAAKVENVKLAERYFEADSNAAKMVELYNRLARKQPPQAARSAA